MNDTFAITLTTEEQEIARQIELDQSKVRDHEKWQRNSDLALRLFISLYRRNGIPAHRWAWLEDPEYFVGGRGNSRREMFERNGSKGEDMVRHNNFLAYIQYFIFGPNLPSQTIEAFADKVMSCGQVTSGDIVPLGTLARKLTRERGLVSSVAAEEFMKLAVELGMSAGQATSIRTQVMRA